jgi:acetyl esterase/lipase
MVAWLCDRVIDGDYVVIPLLIVLVRIGIVRLAIWRVGSLRMISGLIVGAAVLVVVGLVGKRMRAQEKRVPTEDGIVYGVADGQTLTMDYYAPKEKAHSREKLRPIGIIIHGGGYHGGDSKSGSEAYAADFLAPAGYAVFSVNYRLAPKYPHPYMVLDVQRAVRFIRHNAQRWNADGARIVLVGGSAGGFLSNMVGLLNAAGDPNATDPVDRESAKAQAVVSLYAQSSFEFVPLNADVHRLLDPLIAEKGEREAIREASPITYVNKDDPPFLEILGDQDEYIPFAEATNLQDALHKVGVRCDIIRIPGGKHGTGGWNKLPGVPDWERGMTEWLNARLRHEGPIGEGIRARVAVTASPQ